MSESKFSGPLSRLKKAREPAARSKQSISPSAPDQALTGHYRGKRSDPEWANVTILMRRSVKRDVRYLLEGEGRDLSTLINELLTDWVARHKT